MHNTNDTSKSQINWEKNTQKVDPSNSWLFSHQLSLSDLTIMFGSQVRTPLPDPRLDDWGPFWPSGTPFLPLLFIILCIIYCVNQLGSFSSKGWGCPNFNRAKCACLCIFVFLCCIYAILFCIFASSQERRGGGQIWAANGSVGVVGLAASGGARWNLYSELFTKIRKAGSEHKRSWNFPISTVYGSIWIHYLVKYSVKLLP